MNYQAAILIVGSFLTLTSVSQAATRVYAECTRSGDCTELAGSAHGGSECTKYEILKSGKIVEGNDGTFTVISENGTVIPNLIREFGKNSDGRPITEFSVSGIPILSFESYPQIPNRLYQNSRAERVNVVGGLNFSTCELL